MNKIKHKELPVQIAKYSLCFLVFAFFCVVIFFLADGKSMFDHNDGLKQQYMFFVTSGNIMRVFFKNIFIDHIFEFPVWNSSIGMGSDINAICNPITNPLHYILLALIPVEYTEHAFNFIVIYNLYLSGFAFLLFAYQKGYKGFNAIAGAIIYVFSATTFVLFMQVGFSSYFILFPLLLFGTDKAWKNDRSILYVLILTYSMVVSYYYTYMMLILLVAYCIIRFFCEEGRSLKKLFTLLGRFVILTLLSLSIGIGMILPKLIRISGLSRLKTHYDIEILNLEVIKRFFSYGFACIQADGDALIGVSSFAAVAAICLLASKKKEPVIKWCLSLCLISFAFPFIGSVLNGFNYSSLRYIFSLIFCVAYLVTVSFDSVKILRGKLWYLSLGVSLLYAVICFLFIDDYAVISAFSLIITVTLVGCINHFERHLKKAREILYFAVILFSCVIIGYTCIHVSLSPSLMDSGSVYNKVFVDGGMDLRRSINDPDYRSDVITTDFNAYVTNSSMAAEVSGFDLYCSEQSQLVEDYFSSLNVLGNPMEFSLSGLRGRSYLELLNACRYIVRSEEDTCIRVPYSYEYVNTDGDFSLYQTGKDVSLVYFYDDVISYDTYSEMDPLMRETNLMYSMVVDDPGQPENNVVSDLTSVPFKIGKTENIFIDGNKFTVGEDGGYIMLDPEDIEAGQISVFLKGLTNSTVNNWYYRNAVALIDSDNKPIVIEYSAKCPTTDKYYYGNDNVLFSFESIDEKVDKICLFFTNPGEFFLDDIQIWSRPYEKQGQTVDAFYKHAGMDNISYDYSGNHLNISATAESGKYLFVAIPYSEGWKAKVDGEPVQIIKANIAFMAIPVTEGSHNIEMTYRTPNLTKGLVVSAAGIILYIGYMIYEKKKRLKET